MRIPKIQFFGTALCPRGRLVESVPPVRGACLADVCTHVMQVTFFGNKIFQHPTPDFIPMIGRAPIRVDIYAAKKLIFFRDFRVFSGTSSGSGYRRGGSSLEPPRRERSGGARRIPACLTYLCTHAMSCR